MSASVEEVTVLSDRKREQRTYISLGGTEFTFIHYLKNY